MRVTNIHPITQIGDNSDEFFYDGRPCFSPDGNTVLFERIKAKQEVTQQQLWTVNLPTNSENLYYKSDTYGCLRASWSWNPKPGLPQIAFTGIYPQGNTPTSRIMLLDENGANNSAIHLSVPNYQDAQLSYPAWYPNEPALLMTNYSQLELLKVNIISLESSVLTPNTYWSGMGTLNSVNPEIIAYAGQSKGFGKYHQQKNKVLLQIDQNSPVIFSDPSPLKIGRAPWFNPDGTLMAFEAKSNKDKLQIFIKSFDLSNLDTPIIPVSNPKFASQHAKFSPDGSQLVWAQSNGKEKKGEGRSQIYMGTVEY